MPELVTTEVKLNYLRVGRGDDLVLIHGLGANLSFWYFGAAGLLAQKRNVLMYDLRGHGRSSMPANGYDLVRMSHDLAHLLDHLGISSADVVGHSFGGRIALAFAALYPDRTRRLLIADTQIRALQPPVRLRDWPHWEKWKQDLRSGGLQDFPDEDAVIDYRLLADFTRKAADLTTGARPNGRLSLRSREMGQKGLQRWQDLLGRTTAGRDFENESPLSPSTLKSIQAPTMLMFGQFSHCLPTAGALKRCLTDASLVFVPGAGHFFPIVKPGFFARATDSFLAGQPSRSTIVDRLARRARRRRIVV